MEGDRYVERIIDPRLGAASYQKSEGSSNIIDDLSDEDHRGTAGGGVGYRDGHAGDQ